MKFGAWIHERDLSLEAQIVAAKQNGLQSIRSYSLDYAQTSRPCTSKTRHELCWLACISMEKPWPQIGVHKFIWKNFLRFIDWG